jgi:hypothetical protein
VVFGCLLLHKYIYDCSFCETEYTWGTCMDLIPQYLSDSSTLARVESIKVVKFCYILKFEWFWGTFSFTNTHMTVVFVRQNMRGVPVWNLQVRVSVIQDGWRKIDTSNLWNSRINRKSGWLFWTSVGRQMLHNYRNVYSCWETEYVWDTCMKLIPTYLSEWITLPEVKSMKSMKSCYTTVSSSDCKGVYSYVNTHMMVVVVKWNMRGVPVWTWFRHSSVNEWMSFNSHL